MSQNKKRKNKGSIVIEATLLMPIFLGIIYFYILFILFAIETGNYMESMIEYRYESETKSDIRNAETGMRIIEKGDTRMIRMEDTEKLFKIQLELKGYTGNPVEKLRRWQLAVSTIS